MDGTVKTERQETETAVDGFETEAETDGAETDGEETDIES